MRRLFMVPRIRAARRAAACRRIRRFMLFTALPLALFAFAACGARGGTEPPAAPSPAAAQPAVETPAQPPAAETPAPGATVPAAPPSAAADKAGRDALLGAIGDLSGVDDTLKGLEDVQEGDLPTPAPVQ